MMEVISREEAIIKGEKYYFTGMPCAKRNHISKRIVSSFSCWACRRELLEKKRASAGVVPRPKTDEERKERRKKALQKYAANNKQKIKLALEKYKLNNREKLKQIKRKWAEKQPKEYFRLKSHKRRTLKIGKITKTIKDTLFKLQKGMCAVCKNKLTKYEIDHIIPLAKGGDHADSNLQLLCPSCNRSKAAKHPVDFMQERGYLL